jgi:hypothetical protein
MAIIQIQFELIAIKGQKEFQTNTIKYCLSFDQILPVLKSYMYCAIEKLFDFRTKLIFSLFISAVGSVIKLSLLQEIMQACLFFGIIGFNLLSE